MANGNGKQNLVKPHILLIGLALVAFNSYWCLMGTEVWHSTQLTIASLFFNAVFTLLVFVLVNLLLQRFIPRLAMSQADSANHLCHGGDGVNDQRTYHDGVPHPCPHTYVSVCNPRKRMVIALWKQYSQLDRR